MLISVNPNGVNCCAWWQAIASREATLAKLKAQRCKTEDEKRVVTDRYRQVQAELHEMRERVKQGEVRACMCARERE